MRRPLGGVRPLRNVDLGVVNDMKLFSQIRLFWLVSLTFAALAQAPNDRFSIEGIVTDSSGAGVPNVKITLTGNTANPRTTATDYSGTFRFTAVTRGSFEIRLQSEGFASEKIAVRISDRSPAPLRIVLKLADIRQEVTVTDSAHQVSTNGSDNLDTVTLDREMLDSLPIFDQNYVAAMSQFLDPGSIGTGGVTLVVDG